MSPSDRHQAGSAPAAINMRVHDMTCGHCAAAIKKAVQATIPGTEVSADPASKLVSVTGPVDFARLKEILAKAGFTATMA
mgnify:CR=1 FL=1